MDHSKFSLITTFIFDVDGVLTDGSLLVTEEGHMLRKMNVRDGQAIKIALDQEYRVIIITKGASTGVRNRLSALGVNDIFDRLKEKRSAFEEVVKKYNLSQDEILYMGDDLPDLELLDKVGIFSCPSDATRDVLNKAAYISPIEGGKGCVRDIIERVMRVRRSWPAL